MTSRAGIRTGPSGTSTALPCWPASPTPSSPARTRPWPRSPASRCWRGRSASRWRSVCFLGIMAVVRWRDRPSTGEAIRRPAVGVARRHPRRRGRPGTALRLGAGRRRAVPELRHHGGRDRLDRPRSLRSRRLRRHRASRWRVVGGILMIAGVALVAGSDGVRPPSQLHRQDAIMFFLYGSPCWRASPARSSRARTRPSPNPSRGRCWRAWSASPSASARSW